MTVNSYWLKWPLQGLSLPAKISTQIPGQFKETLMCVARHPSNDGTWDGPSTTSALAIYAFFLYCHCVEQFITVIRRQLSRGAPDCCFVPTDLPPEHKSNVRWFCLRICFESFEMTYAFLCQGHLQGGEHILAAACHIVPELERTGTTGLDKNARKRSRTIAMLS